MSRHQAARKRATARRTRRTDRPMLTTAAFIGGAGILAGAPAAAFLAAPAASAQPQSHCATSVLATPCTSADPTLGDGSIAELTARLTARTPSDPFAPGWLTARAPSDPFVALLNSPLMDLAGMVPVLNLFIGNGMDGTSLHPNGYGGGFFIGNGGDGWNSTTPGVAGGNGGSGLLFGSGGKGGNGYSDIPTTSVWRASTAWRRRWRSSESSTRTP